MKPAGWMGLAEAAQAIFGYFAPVRQAKRRHSLILAAVLLFSIAPAATAVAESAGRPNVVFILADDLGWGELGCYGQEKIPTPNIDRLAKQGTRFTQHYSGAPVCAPSRCVLMTGKHGGHAEVRGNLEAPQMFPEFDEGQYPLSEDAVTIAQVFQDAGYSTGAIGKWGLGPVGSSGDPNRKGFQTFFGYNCQRAAHSYYPSHLWRNAERLAINRDPIPGHEKQQTIEAGDEKRIGKVYAPKLMIAEAVDFIEENRSQPFFLYLPFIQPHVAMHPPSEIVDRFPVEWDDVPYRGECGYLPHSRPRAAYAAMISELDDHVGMVLDTLDDLGLADRTLVVFTSDNGTTHAPCHGTRFHVGGVDPGFFNSTAGLRGFKGSVFEGGIRVPLVVRFPGRIPAGRVSDAPGYFADWFPTLCDAAGLTKPDGLDGETLWPVLTGADAPRHRKPMIWVFPQFAGQVAVRIGDFKVVRQDLVSETPGPWQVYDISKDPGEKTDRAAWKVDIVRQATAILAREVAQNAVFPLSIQGVTASPATADERK